MVFLWDGHRDSGPAVRPGRFTVCVCLLCTYSLNLHENPKK